MLRLPKFDDCINMLACRQPRTERKQTQMCIRDSWNTIGETYERMLNYKKQHQLKTSDLYIEYDVVNNFITKNENEFVAKVEVEIIE